MNRTRSHILALDQGTTSSRAIVFDALGQAAAVAQQEFLQIYPRPGWVEHDPATIWKTQLNTARRALRLAKLSAADIAAIGITNQRETTLVWDRTTGKPIGNAIVWQDRRTADICDTLRRDRADRLIRRKTGLELDAYFSATKIRWLLRHTKGALAKARAGRLAFGTIDSWLVWNLTGGQAHITDVTNASRTMLFNIHTGKWDDELLKLFGIPQAVLPKVASCSEVYAQTQALGQGIPIAGIAGDQHAALFGQCCHKPGMVKNTYGTGCFMLMHTGDKPMASRSKLLTTVAWKIGDKTEYALEGSVFVAGAVTQWLRDELGIIKSSAEIERLAQRVPDNGGVHLVPAFTGLGAPHWDPHARGTITGLTRGSTKAHIARAALEGIAFQVNDVIAAMERDAGTKLRELRVDGGASTNNLLMQFQSDLLDVPVIRPANTETTALGAAYLAGLAVGTWKSKREIARRWKIARRFKPSMKPATRKTLVAGWTKALKQAIQ